MPQRYLHPGMGSRQITVVISPTVDGGTRQDAATTHYGTNASLFLRSDAPNRRFSLILPDLSGLVGTTIVSATLTLTCNLITTHAQTISIYRILAANDGWTENCVWNFADGAGATDRWAGDVGGDGGVDAGCSVSGTDFNAAAIGSVVTGLADPVGTIYNATLNVAQFQAMVAANYGFLLATSAPALNALASSDHATAGYRPYLTVVYRP